MPEFIVLRRAPLKTCYLSQVSKRKRDLQQPLIGANATRLLYGTPVYPKKQSTLRRQLLENSLHKRKACRPFAVRFLVWFFGKFPLDRAEFRGPSLQYRSGSPLMRYRGIPSWKGSASRRRAETPRRMAFGFDDAFTPTIRSRPVSIGPSHCGPAPLPCFSTVPAKPRQPSCPRPFHSEPLDDNEWAKPQDGDGSCWTWT